LSSSGEKRMEVRGAVRASVCTNAPSKTAGAGGAAYAGNLRRRDSSRYVHAAQGIYGGG